MALSFFRSFKRPFAFVFISVLGTQTAYPAISFSQKTMAPGNGQPVSASTTSMVDPYTGDFHYSVPLLTVPGPNGESVDVSANYHAGIRVDEKASWLGLGWDYNPGEISRQVVGAPDDASEFPIFSRQRPMLSLSDQYASTSYVGAFYPARINNTPSYASFPNPSFTPFNPQTKSMDIFANDRVLTPSERSYMLNGAPASDGRFRKYSLPYRSLAYDHYMVSSPGLSGQLRPYYFGNMDLVENKSHNAAVTISSSSAFNKKAQFYFENSVQKTVTAQSSAELNAQNMLKSGVYVKYYTNADINNSANLYNNATQAGFLDYKVVSSGSRRSGVDNDGIGAFEVTDPNGMTYHYSLAVYASEESEKSLNYDNSMGYSFKPVKYASSWKLTAVTGPDYTDANNDHMADTGDSGYWIAYNYSLWSSSYLWSSSQYGLKDDIYAPNFLYNQQGPNSIFGWVSSNYVPNGYIPKKSVITGKTEVYYLNNIQTATHGPVREKHPAG